MDWDRHYLYDDYFKTPEARELFERNTGRKGLTYLEMSNWFLDNVCTIPWNAQMDGGKPLEQGKQAEASHITAKHIQDCTISIT